MSIELLQQEWKRSHGIDTRRGGRRSDGASTRRDRWSDRSEIVEVAIRRLIASKQKRGMVDGIADLDYPTLTPRNPPIHRS